MLFGICKIHTSEMNEEMLKKIIKKWYFNGIKKKIESLLESVFEKVSR